MKKVERSTAKKRAASKSSGVPHTPLYYVRLTTLAQIRAEMAKLYRMMMSGRIDSSTMARGIYGLGQIADRLMLEDAEARLRRLEEADDLDGARGGIRMPSSIAATRVQ